MYSIRTIKTNYSSLVKNKKLYCVPIVNVNGILNKIKASLTVLCV